MNVTVDTQGDSKVAVIESSDLLIGDVQAALDLMATVKYNYDCHKLVIDKANIAEAFFELKTKLAGEIAQKFVNYGVKLAIVGNYEGYDSRSLRDFIYESNQGRQLFFMRSKEEALAALHGVN